MLADPTLNMVLLDEITYMVAYDYLPLNAVLDALKNRPAHQTVIVTGRGCHRDILELADTVSELRPVKHAFDAGIKAQPRLITKEKARCVHRAFRLTVVIPAARATVAAVHLAMAFHRTTDLVRLHTTTIFLYRHF